MKWDETGKNIQSHGNLLFDVCLYIGEIDMTSTKWRHQKSKHALHWQQIEFQAKQQETPWETYSSVTDTAKWATGDAEIIEAKISSTTATHFYTGHDLVLHKQFCAFKGTTTEHINPHHPCSIILKGQRAICITSKKGFICSSTWRPKRQCNEFLSWGEAMLNKLFFIPFSYIAGK